MSTSTPWGQSQISEQFCRGIIFYSTASHGGYHLSPTRNMVVPEYMRDDAGWYEKDCAWAIAATVFPEPFVKKMGTERILETIKDTFRNWYPDMYEKFYDTKIRNGTSFVRDKEHFYEEHKNDWIVISAIGSGNLVECIALIGGLDYSTDTKTFMVALEEYNNNSKYGFVINLNKHVEKGNEPTWKDTLFNPASNMGHISNLINTAHLLGYKYICWNDRIYTIIIGENSPADAMDTGFIIDDMN